MLSQTVEYALRAMMYLASLDGEPVNCETIATATQVPQGYLSKVMRELVCAELVRSFRGPNGGFALARPIGAITVLDVVTAVDPIPRIRRCPLDNPNHTNLCPLHQCMDNAMAQMETTFGSTSLGTVLDACKSADGCRAPFPVTPTELKDEARDTSA